MQKRSKAPVARKNMSGARLQLLKKCFDSLDANQAASRSTPVAKCTEYHVRGARKPGDTTVTTGPCTATLALATGTAIALRGRARSCAAGCLPQTPIALRNLR